MSDGGKGFYVGQHILYIAGTNEDWIGTILEILPDDKVKIDLGNGYTPEVPAWMVSPDEDYEKRGITLK